MGLKFTCGSTPTAYLYDNTDCSGTALNTTTDFGDETVICNGQDCPVIIVTSYEGTDGSCDATGDFSQTPIAIGCAEIDSTTSFDIECSGSGSLTQKIYANGDCSGDAVQTVTQSSGCQDGAYVEFTCAAPGKLVAITMMLALLTSYLFQ